MANNKTKLTIEEITGIIRKEWGKETIEGQLLMPKLIRELYKQVGEIKEEDFPSIFETAGRCWKKGKGYTTYITVLTKRCMEDDNHSSTRWRVQRPSQTKLQIVDRYVRDGWSCEVQSYNVICRKYMPHPKYKDIWVRFYSSRDCNRYELVIVKDANE